MNGDVVDYTAPQAQASTDMPLETQTLLELKQNSVCNVKFQCSMNKIKLLEQK